MVLTQGRRSKQLLQSLSASQEDDKFLPPFNILFIRHNLICVLRSGVVHVSVHLTESHFVEADIVVFKKLPNFIQSQLQAQNITDNDNDSIWTSTKPILHFIRSHLRIFNQSRGYPTLFRWRCESGHRLYVLLVFLDFKMVSRTYSSLELLQLRNSPPAVVVFRELYEKAKGDAGLKEVIRLPPRALTLIAEEEANTISVAQQASAPQLDGTTSEWRYHGRSDSEQNEPAPISAPTGIEAQRHEGFQRFYQAVVSPTHIRVTASGRIVPNTRGSSSPTAKFPKERSGDLAPMSRPQSSDQQESTPYPIMQNQFGSYRHAYSGFLPGMPHGLVTGPTQFPYMPFPYAYSMGGGYAMSAHPSAFHQVSSRPVVEQSSQPTGIGGHVETSVGGLVRPVPLSPPEQFDPTRPYTYNGQYIMPTGHPFYPYGMAPPHAFTAASMNGPVAALPQSVPSNSVAPQTTVQQSQPAPAPAPAQTSNMDTTVETAKFPAKLPKSSILPSGITKNQIGSLRHTLRYLEDQLQYNRHQIDERVTEVEVQEVRQQIQTFEKILEEQMVTENPEKAKVGNLENKSIPGTTAPVPKTLTTTMAINDTQSSVPYSNVSVSREEKPVALPVEAKLTKPKIFSRPVTGLNSSKSVSAFPPLKLPGELRSENTERLRKVSSLPMKAALAPPFQPRQQATISASSTGNSSATSGGETDLFPTTHSLVAKRPSEWKSFFTNPQSTIGCGTPYLVGQLPYGVGLESARDTDYFYHRDLTEDELRARHMYWGKTPRHLQKGLPKFDGKDFYPPSPVKGQSTDTSCGSSQQPTSGAMGAKMDQTTGLPKTSDDPFHAMAETGSATVRNRIGDVTQSEALPRFDQSTSDASSDIPRSGSCISQVIPSYDSFRKALAQQDHAAPDSSNSKSSSDEGEDDKGLLFRGRQAMVRSGEKPQAAVWQNMLKNGKSSANAAPGKVSPMTAQGVLPNYSGHATASLTPTIANTTSSRCPGTKVGDLSNVRSVQGGTEKRGENRPPADIGDESLRGVSSHDNNHHGFASR